MGFAVRRERRAGAAGCQAETCHVPAVCWSWRTGRCLGRERLLTSLCGCCASVRAGKGSPFNMSMLLLVPSLRPAQNRGLATGQRIPSGMVTSGKERLDLLELWEIRQTSLRDEPVLLAAAGRRSGAVVVFSTCKAFPTLIFRSGLALGGCSLLPVPWLCRGSVKHITRVTQLSSRRPRTGRRGAWRWAGAGEEPQRQQHDYSKSSFMN